MNNLLLFFCCAAVLFLCCFDFIVFCFSPSSQPTPYTAILFSPLVFDIFYINFNSINPFLSYLYFIAFSSLLKPLNVPHITPNPYIARSYPRNPKFTRTAPGSSSTPVTPSSSGKVKSRSRSKSPFRSFRWRSAKKLIAGSHHSDDEGILGVWMDWNHYVD